MNWKTFYALLSRDGHVARRNLLPMLAQNLLQPLLLTFVFGRVLTSSGMMQAGYKSVLLPGVMGSFSSPTGGVIAWLTVHAYHFVAGGRSVASVVETPPDVCRSPEAAMACWRSGTALTGGPCPGPPISAPSLIPTARRNWAASSGPVRSDGRLPRLSGRHNRSGTGVNGRRSRFAF